MSLIVDEIDGAQRFFSTDFHFFRYCFWVLSSLWIGMQYASAKSVFRLQLLYIFCLFLDCNFAFCIMPHIDYAFIDWIKKNRVFRNWRCKLRMIEFNSTTVKLATENMLIQTFEKNALCTLYTGASDKCAYKLRIITLNMYPLSRPICGAQLCINSIGFVYTLLIIIIVSIVDCIQYRMREAFHFIFIIKDQIDKIKFTFSEMKTIYPTHFSYLHNHNISEYRWYSNGHASCTLDTFYSIILLEQSICADDWRLLSFCSTL